MLFLVMISFKIENFYFFCITITSTHNRPTKSCATRVLIAKTIMSTTVRKFTFPWDTAEFTKFTGMSPSEYFGVPYYRFTKMNATFICDNTPAQPESKSKPLTDQLSNGRDILGKIVNQLTHTQKILALCTYTPLAMQNALIKLLNSQYLNMARQLETLDTVLQTANLTLTSITGTEADTRTWNSILAANKPRQLNFLCKCDQSCSSGSASSVDDDVLGALFQMMTGVSITRAANDLSQLFAGSGMRTRPEPSQNNSVTDSDLLCKIIANAFPQPNRVESGPITASMSIDTATASTAPIVEKLPANSSETAGPSAEPKGYVVPSINDEEEIECE